MNNKAAFPVHPKAHELSDLECSALSGMSLRDYFAAKATEEDVCFHMTHHPTGRGGYIQNSGTGVPNRSREQAKFQYADAMLAARGDA